MYSKYTGVILKNFPLGEADELLTVYTLESGKMRVMARGIRRIKSRLAGALQCLNEVEMELASSHLRAGSIPVVVSARIKTMNEYLRQNLKKFAFALVGVETLYRLTPDAQENRAAYQTLARFLRELGEQADEAGAVRQFQLRLLQVFGFADPGVQAVNETELNQLLNNVLEREIKSNKFLKTI